MADVVNYKGSSKIIQKICSEINKLAEAGGEKNTIETISVNSSGVPPDDDRNVNITVPVIWKGTAEEWKALETLDASTLYLISGTAVYYGEDLITGTAVERTTSTEGGDSSG